ncbi:hypothetical protein HRG84_06445 [Flavisolibacter sp. BT320]|nr:hypothetical protein [Flavisolibacter longurius]
MRSLLTFSAIALTAALLSCGSGSNSGSTAQTFCDTACNTDSLQFTGDHKLKPVIDIKLNACKADSMFWTHEFGATKLLVLQDDLGQEVYLNKNAIDVYFKDTSYAWMQFNDCKTGRGFLIKLPFSKTKERRKVTGAFTKFDPKFSIEPGLAVYTDRGTVFVEDMETEQQASMPFDAMYDIDFNNIHEMVDSIHVTKERIWVQMIREGQKKPYEKKISL